MKIKIQIMTIFGGVLFEHETENNTNRKTVEALLQANKGEVIRNANLSNMDLSEIAFDNSKFYNSTFDNSTFDKATIDNIKKSNSLSLFDSIKADFWMVLLYAKNEIPGLRKALVEGRVDGSTYEGACACLVGTIANIRQCDFDEMADVKPNSGRPAEKWFMAIRKGSTPENNPMCALTVEWIDEFWSLLTK